MVYQGDTVMKGREENRQPLRSRDNKSDRFLRVEMTLRDVLYVSYAVQSGRLRHIVPRALRLATAGNDMAFISVVVLKSTRVRMNLMPFPRFNYNQLNVRTYVIDPVSGRQAVYFIKSGVTSRFISLVTRTTGIPWQFINLEIKADSDSYTASGHWEADYSIQARSLSDQSSKPAFFEDKKSAADFLVRPLIGFVGDKKRLGRFTIRHPEVETDSWQLAGMDFPLFNSLGVVYEGDSPHSVFYLPQADFSIYLPPTKIRQ
jgi:uncharacterized protein YqjF (DUF2071 family)